MKVVKFGGSSVASAEQISKIIDIVTSDADRRIVVVSAPGKRTSDDTKVTDLLIALVNQVIEGGDFESVSVHAPTTLRSIKRMASPLLVS